MVATAVMAAATVGGAVIGSNANKKAASTAANAADNSARLNDQLVRDQMARADQYTSGLTDYAGQGASALAQRFGMTGASSQPSYDPRAADRAGFTPNQMPMQSMGAQPDFMAYGAQNPDIQREAARVVGDDPRFPTPEDYYAFHYQTFGQQEGRDLPTTGGQQSFAQTAPSAPQGPSGPMAPQDMPYYNQARPDTGARPDFLTAEYQAGPSEDDYFGDFEESEYYNWLQDQARRAVNVSQFSRGIGSSGGTMKALQDRAGMVASGYRGQWFGEQDSKYRSAIGQSQFANQFNLQNIGQQNALRQNSYDIDATRSDARYDSDRGYQANRYDTQTDNLFGLTGIGTGAINTALGQGQAGTNALIASNNTRADTTANAAIAGANSTNALLGQGLNALGYFAGNRSTGARNALTANNRYSVEGLY